MLAMLARLRPFLMAGRSTPEEAEEEGKSVLGKWKWLIVVVILVVIVIGIIAASNVINIFTTPGGG